MENQNPGAAEPQNVSEAELNKDLTLPQVDPENATPEQVKELINLSNTALAQKKHWRGKAIDPATGKPYRDLLTEAQANHQPQPTKPATEQPPELEGRIAGLEQAEEKRQFGHAHNLSPEATDHVFAFANGSGIKPAEALEKPFVKSALESLAAQAKADGATPSPSGRSPRVDGKSFSEMDATEREKNFGTVVQSVARGKR